MNDLSVALVLIFALSSIGMSHIIVDSTIMQWFRDSFKKVAHFIRLPFMGGVVDCYLCCGVWCGFLMGYIWITKDPLQIFACGCAAGFLSNLAALLSNLMEAMTMVNLPTDNEE